MMMRNISIETRFYAVQKSIIAWNLGVPKPVTGSHPGAALNPGLIGLQGVLLPALLLDPTVMSVKSSGCAYWDDFS
jgi:hypothetical protein